MTKKVGNKFNKVDLVNYIAKEGGLTKTSASEMLDACLAGLVSLVGDMNSGDKLTLIGYGSVEVVERAERKCKNPRTKEEMVIPAKTAVKIKAGKAFQELVADK